MNQRNGHKDCALVLSCARVPGSHLLFASLLLEQQQTCLSSLDGCLPQITIQLLLQHLYCNQKRQISARAGPVFPPCVMLVTAALIPVVSCCPAPSPPTHPSTHSCTFLTLTPVAVMDVQLPKDYVCKCQCAVRLKITLPAAGCSYEGPYPTVIFSSGFQVSPLCTVWSIQCFLCRFLNTEWLSYALFGRYNGLLVQCWVVG
jgi:hypothetical protein